MTLSNRILIEQYLIDKAGKKAEIVGKVRVKEESQSLVLAMIQGAENSASCALRKATSVEEYKEALKEIEEKLITNIVPYVEHCPYQPSDTDYDIKIPENILIFTKWYEMDNLAIRVYDKNGNMLTVKDISTIAMSPSAISILITKVMTMMSDPTDIGECVGIGNYMLYIFRKEKNSVKEESPNEIEYEIEDMG